MELFFERNKVFLFSIKLDPSTTVLEMKQKIERSTGITVSNQTIFYKGKILHTDRDTHTLRQCKIVNKSRLELYFNTSKLSYSRLSHNITQALQQTKQSPAPKEIINIEDSPEKNQDSSLMVPSSSFDELFGIKEGNVSVQEPSWRDNNRQDWLQRQSSSSTSNIFGDFLFGEDVPLSTELFSNIHSFGYTSITQEQRINHQDLPVSQVVQTEKNSRIRDVINTQDSPEKNQDSSLMLPSSSVDELFGIQEGNVRVQEPSRRNNNRQDFLQRESSSSTSNIFGDFLFGEDVPLPTELFSNIQSFGYASTTQQEQRINHQGLPVSQVGQTQRPTRSIRDVINIPDSPEKSSNKRAKKLLRVLVLTFPINEDTPARKFPVEVNASDNVEVLRTELAKMQQRSQLLLPEEGYFFIHNSLMLNEKQSFHWNRVDEGDIIAIFPGTVCDDHTNT